MLFYLKYDEVIIMALTEVVTGCNQFLQTIIPNEEVRTFLELLTDYIVKVYFLFKTNFI